MTFAISGIEYPCSFRTRIEYREILMAGVKDGWPVHQSCRGASHKMGGSHFILSARRGLFEGTKD